MPGTNKPAEKPAPRARDRDYRRVLTSVADYVWEADTDWAMRKVMPGRRKLTKMANERVTGIKVLDLVLPEDRPALQKHMDAAFEDPTALQGLSFRIRRMRGDLMRVHVDGMPVYNRHGVITGFCGIARDTTNFPLQAQEFEYRNRLRMAMVQAVGDLLGARDPERNLPRALQTLGEALEVQRVLVFERISREGPSELLYGWEHAELPHPKIESTLTPFDRVDPEVTAFIQELELGRTMLIDEQATGLRAEMLMRAHAKTIMVTPIVMDGRSWGFVAIHDCNRERAWTQVETDSITLFAEMVGATLLRERHRDERRRAEEALALSTQLDSLTRLANRKLFREVLAAAIADEAAHPGGGLAVHYIDLDRFKGVNDALGRPSGDILLQQASRRISEVARRSELVARFGGDEFAVLERGVADEEDAGHLARRIIDALRAPYLIHGREFHSGASAGVALYQEGCDAEMLLSHAELALYRAKTEGRQTYRFYTRGMDEEARRRIELAEELRQAVARDELTLLYQPQVDGATGAITGVEALIRWRHPRRGLVSPVDFIPEAEASGLIIQMGEWILKTACREAKAWLDDGLQAPAISVNMSAVQFRRPLELQEEVAAILRETGLPAHHLQLELTETALMEASRAQDDVLARFHSQGLKISLDDFGTGYSSLDYLHRYPVDQIKIAQVFVDGILDNAGDRAIVKAAISLARELGLRVVAEGVETLEQSELLQSWGCSEMQGFYFARPIEGYEFRALLAQGGVRLSPAPKALLG